MNEIKLYSEIVLMNDKPSVGLLKGDVGIVVEIYGNNEGYEVEFMTKEGRTVAVETLDVSEIRAISTRDMLHIRELEQVA
jgi:ATP-dependent exoDNAse (exonuclease V) alpha subunit